MKTKTNKRKAFRNRPSLYGDVKLDSIDREWLSLEFDRLYKEIRCIKRKKNKRA